MANADPFERRASDRHGMDFDDMLRKIKDRQWALVDIDWDAPGAETISPDLHATQYVGQLRTVNLDDYQVVPATRTTKSRIATVS